MESRLELEILRQPDDSTCGPTCLHAVYRFYGDEVDLDGLVREVRPLATGGTMSVSLACHALRRGYRATIHPYNPQLFDPTWFRMPVDLAAKLREQLGVKGDEFRLRHATEAYLEFLELGGRLADDDLTPALLREHLRNGQPLLTGVSATYLYADVREVDSREDDVRGQPVGHFVVLSGYDARTDEVLVADPLHDNPRYRTPYYWVDVHRLIGAVFLGVLTYDANLLSLEPPGDAREPSPGTG